MVAAVCSVALHLVLAAALFLAGSLAPPPVIVKRGEPLLVDIAPDRPEERAPRGDPSQLPAPARPRPRRVEPPAPRPRAPEPAPAEPKVAEAPRPAPGPPASQPSDPVARVAPPAPEPRPAPSLEPAPRAEEPAPPVPPPAPSETARSEPTAPAPPPALSPGPDPRTALARPRLDVPPGMFRRPGGGLQGGRGGIEGEPIPLDTKDPKYHEYFEKVRQKIKANWGYPREAGERNIEGQLLIEFHIARDGHLSYLELVRSSGVKILDDYAMNAVRLAQPFPPVPEGLLAKHAVPISGLFVYRVVDAGSLVNQFLR